MVTGAHGAQVVRFCLAGPRPPLTQAVTVGELTRRSAMAQHGRWHGGQPPTTLSGKDDRGHPLRGHTHTHYLATDEDSDGHIDHITLWTPVGLDSAELESAVRITDLVQPGGPALRVELVAQGGPLSLPGILRGPARVWVSHTPFVLARHPKVKGGVTTPLRRLDTPEDQVRADLQRRGLAAHLLMVEPVSGVALGQQVLTWSRFQRSRSYRPPPVDFAAGFRLVFAEPVRGPIALGYGCHQGLGLFVAVAE